MTTSRSVQYDEDLWRSVQLTKDAIRARAKLMLFTVLITIPFVLLSGIGAWLCGLQPHEVTGICCYNTMVTSLFFFDTIRNAAHSCFDEAQEEGLVTYRDGIPVVDREYPHHRLATISFAIGGRTPWW